MLTTKGRPLRVYYDFSSSTNNRGTNVVACRKKLFTMVFYKSRRFIKTECALW